MPYFSTGRKYIHHQGLHTHRPLSFREMVKISLGLVMYVIRPWARNVSFFTLGNTQDPKYSTHMQCSLASAFVILHCTGEEIAWNQQPFFPSNYQPLADRRDLPSEPKQERQRAVIMQHTKLQARETLSWGQGSAQLLGICSAYFLR
jgi:hypothetical protein